MLDGGMNGVAIGHFPQAVMVSRGRSVNFSGIQGKRTVRWNDGERCLRIPQCQLITPPFPMFLNLVRIQPNSFPFFGGEVAVNVVPEGFVVRYRKFVRLVFFFAAKVSPLESRGSSCIDRKDGNRINALSGPCNDPSYGSISGRYLHTHPWPLLQVDCVSGGLKSFLRFLLGGNASGVHLVGLGLKFSDSIPNIPVDALSASLKLECCGLNLISGINQLLSLPCVISGDRFHRIQLTPCRYGVGYSAGSNEGGHPKTSFCNGTGRAPRIPPFFYFGLGLVVLSYGVLNLLVYVCFNERRQRLYRGLAFAAIGISLLCHGIFSA